MNTPGEMGARVSPLFVEGARLLVGTSWDEIDAFVHPLAKLKLRYHAAKTGLYGGILTNVSKKTYMYTLVPEEHVGLPSGDMIVSRMINKRKSERDNIVVFVYVIRDKDRFVANKYWLTAIQPDGQFLKNYEHICENKSQLKNELSNLSAIGNYDIAMLDTQRAELESILGEESFADSDVNWNFAKSEFKQFLDDEGCRFSRYHEKFNIQVNKLVYTSGAIATVLVGFGSFSFFYQMNSNAYFDDGRAYRDVRNLEDNLAERISFLTEKKSWTDKSFQEVVKSQYFENEKEHPYRPSQVALVIREINKTLPTYLAEFEFESIVYEKGKFFAEYVRNPTGKGVYFVLDEKVKAIDSLVDTYSVEPYELKELATIRVYEIIPDISLDGVAEAQAQLQSLAKVKRTETSLKEKADDAESVAKKLKRTHQIYRGLNFVDKWIMMEPKDLAEQAKRYQKNLDRLLEEIKEIETTLSSIDPSVIPQQSLLGNKLDFISMMHVDSFFNWSPPNLIETFPDADILKGKNGKNKDSSYKPAIFIYRVKVQTQEDMDEGKTRSYGVDDMLKLSHYIERPFVDVERVKYSRQDEQWEYDMIFYRKTNTYDKFFKEKD